MSNDHKDLLADVFCDMLEKLAFMFAEVVEENDLDTPPSPSLRATIAFQGPTSGELIVTMPEESCVEIAQNMLGEDVDDESRLSKATDALSELVNVVCGHLVTGIAGDEPVFELSTPVIEHLDNFDWKESRNAGNSVALLIDDEAPASVKLLIK